MIVLFSILFFSLFSMVIPENSYADEKMFISDITIENGTNGDDSLIKNGYSVIYPAFKDDKDKDFWIGFKKTSDRNEALTDIQVNSETSLEGIKNTGKSPIISLYFNSSNVEDSKKFEDVMPIPNNGSFPISSQNGIPTIYNTVNGKGYLCLIREEVWKNYISEIIVIKEKNKKEAINRLCQRGCEYYIDNDFSNDNSSSIIIGYSKTNDEKEAIKDIIGLSNTISIPSGYNEVAEDSNTISGKKLLVTKDDKYGNPITDIDYIKNFSETKISSKQLTELVSNKGNNRITIPFILNNQNYSQMIQKKESFIISSIICDDDTDTGICLTTQEKGIKEKQKIKKEIIKESIKKPVEATKNENTGSEKDEKIISGERAESESVSTEGVSTEGVSTEGVGTVITQNPFEFAKETSIVIPFVIAIIIPIITIIIKKKLDKHDNG